MAGRIFQDARLVSDWEGGGVKREWKTVHLLVSGAVFIHRPDFPFHVCSRPVSCPALYLSTLTFAFTPVSGLVQAVFLRALPT